MTQTCNKNTILKIPFLPALALALGIGVASLFLCHLQAASARSLAGTQAADFVPDASSLDVGGYHACAVTVGGGVKCWGRNYAGGLGNGTTTDSATPVDVSGLTSGVAAVSTGGYHSCALTVGGNVKCWGSNGSGRLGDGTTTNSSTPVTVVVSAGGPPLSGIVSIAMGEFHSCALINNGEVRCWGDNYYGRLGDGTTNDSSFPVTVTVTPGGAPLSGVAAITAGSTHTCALTTSGGVKCWGHNDEGQLGNGTNDDSSSPVDVTGLTSGVAVITAGEEHTCARTSDGKAKCWGGNGHGQLGDGTTGASSIPVTVTVSPGGLPFSSISNLSAGDSHNCALVNGGVMCWGSNSDYQLGDGTDENRYNPVNMSGLSGVSAVAAGGNSTCARLLDGSIYCWGSNRYGQVGNGIPGFSASPLDVSGAGSGGTALDAGYYHNCMVIDGAAKCWGYNVHGELGDNSTIHRSTPVDVFSLSSGIAGISAGSEHSCARTAGGATCWGDNYYGRLGNNSNIDSLTPVAVSNLTTGISGIQAGGYHSCALVNGGVKCWGYNNNGQLGDTTTTERRTPVDVTGLTSQVTGLAVGGYHTCALTSSGHVRCWGRNYSGQLGIGATDYNAHSTPATVTLSLGGEPLSGVTAIAANFEHTCALVTGGEMRCWGSNDYGNLGNGTLTDSASPVTVTVSLNGPPLSGIASITAGLQHTCGLTTGGRIQCWGDNYWGQLGNGTLIDSPSPVTVTLSAGGDPLTGMVSVSGGGVHTCALTSQGGVKCWGNNTYGQLGIGGFGVYPTPEKVLGFETLQMIYLPLVRK